MIYKALAQILAALAIAFLSKAKKGPEYVSGGKVGKTEKKLREALKKAGWICLVFVFLGCTRVVYIPHGKSVQLRQDIKNVKVWAMDENNKKLPGTLKLIPEGWYCLPLEEEDGD